MNSLIGAKVLFNEMMENNEIREMEGVIISVNANSCQVRYDYWPAGCDDIMHFTTTKSLNDIQLI